MDDKRLFVLITVRHGQSTSKLTFAYDALENGICKKARSPGELSGNVLSDAIRFSNHCITASYGKFDGKYTLCQHTFDSMEADFNLINQFQSLIKDATKKGQPLDYVHLRWNVKV